VIKMPGAQLWNAAQNPTSVDASFEQLEHNAP
jgi:hypothetical protein